MFFSVRLCAASISSNSHTCYRHRIDIGYWFACTVYKERDGESAERSRMSASMWRSETARVYICMLFYLQLISKYLQNAAFNDFGKGFGKCSPHAYIRTLFSFLPHLADVNVINRNRNRTHKLMWKTKGICKESDFQHSFVGSTHRTKWKKNKYQAFWYQSYNGRCILCVCVRVCCICLGCFHNEPADQ